MRLCRPTSRALSSLLRSDPITHYSSPASLFSRQSPFAPFSRAFDDPFFSSPFSAPLYTVYEVRDEDNHTDNNNNNNSNTVKATQHPTETADPQSQQQQPKQQQQMSSDSRLARQEEGKHQRWLDRRSNRHRHNRHHHHHHPLSLFSPFDSLLASPFYGARSYQPPLDITLDLYSTSGAYQVNAAIPGVRKEDIKLTVEDGVLTIEAEKREERGRPTKQQTSSTQPASATETASATTSSETSQADSQPNQSDVKAGTTAAEPQPQQPQSAEAEEDDVSAHHVESYYGRVQRSLTLPEDVDVEGLTAKYEDGVLKIELPRVEEKRQQVKQISIQ